MKYLILLLLVCVSGCEAGHRDICVRGVLYRQTGNGPWVQVDGAPSHSGFTPEPCIPANGPVPDGAE